MESQKCNKITGLNCLLSTIGHNNCCFYKFLIRGAAACKALMTLPLHPIGDYLICVDFCEAGNPQLLGGGAALAALAAPAALAAFVAPTARIFPKAPAIDERVTRTVALVPKKHMHSKYSLSIS